MKLMLIGLAGLIAAAAVAAPALAREPYDDAFFVKPQATAQAFFQDRTSCRTQALHMSDNAAAYSNPQYGAISAMGSALDEDALHEGGLHERLQRAVFNDCMKQLGWSPADLTPAETHELMKASPHHPEPLDAWLKAHEPAETVAADKPGSPGGPALKAAAASAPASVAPAASTTKSAN